MSPSARNHDVLLQHAGFVRALARAVVFDADLARDVEQETWLTALQHAPRDLRSPRAWLAAIVRRMAQRAGRRLDFPGRDAAPEDGFPSPDQLLEQEQARRAMVDAVLRLEEPLRGTLVLHYFDGLELREVALRTKVPLETARSRVKRGLARLREELGRKGNDFEAWSVALVRVLALDPPRLARGFPLFARGLLPWATTMTTTHKLAAVLAAVVLSLATGWIFLAHEAPPAPASAERVEGGRVELASAPESESAPPVESGTSRASAGSTKSELGALRMNVLWAEDRAPAVNVGVRVDAGDPGPGAAPLRVTTDENGRAGIDSLRPGTWIARPCFGGLAFASVGAGETAEVEILIPEGIAVRGAVVDSNGNPVPGAGIFLGAGAADPQWEVALVGHSDANGGFELRSAPAQVGACLSARAADRAPTRQYMLTGAPRSRSEVRLVFEADGTRLSGRVVGFAGGPVAGASVLVGSEREIAIATEPDGTVAQAPIGQLVASDADGRFELEGVPLGSLAVQVRAPGFAPWRGTCDTRATDRLDVRLKAPARIRGTVRDARGEPVAGAAITAEETSFFARSSVRSAADGAYALVDLADGPLLVRAGTQERGFATHTFELELGADVEWNPALGGGAELRGRVEAAGIALDGWVVRGFHRSPDYVQEVRTDAEGRFVLRDCPAELDLALFGRGGTAFPVASESAVRPGPAEVVLRPDPALLPSARIRGRLVDAQHEPVRNADVTAVHARFGRTLIHPDARTGGFEFDRLPPGDWSLQVDAHVAGWAPHRSETRWLAADATWDAGDIVLGAGGTLAVHLRRAAGVEGAASQVLVLGADRRPLQWIEVAGDLARSTPLAPGSYRVTLLVLRDAAVVAAEVTVVAGEETRVELDLERGESVTLHVRGLENLEPDARAEVRLCGSRGEALWWGELARTSPVGVELRWELRPGTYRAELLAPDRPAVRTEIVVGESSRAALSFEIAVPPSSR
jgi:RNA polymerase sigma factor (sigma-70 family)